MSSGNGLIRPLEAAASKAGVQVLLEHRMIALHREQPKSGRVLGIAVDNKGKRSSTSARGKASSSRPAAPAATSISAACSIRA